LARVLIVGCGCRGQALARELRAAGHAVRGTTRDAGKVAAIAAAGAEP
jgi:3-hydroxyisobutyrate dehydrogenase-like beta-hydroxyacid dehydrogenase